MNKISEELAETIDSFIHSVPNSLDWTHKASPEKWSAKEIIGHLTDSAHINLERFVRCTYEENFKLIYFQDEWVAAQHYQEADITELLLLWRLVNKQIARVLNNYPADRWQATCDSNRGKPVYRTVEFLANDYIRHLQHHLNQILNLNNGN